jgi:TPR repeat protein
LGYIYEKGGLLEGPENNPGSFVQLVKVDLQRAHDLYLKAVSFDDNLAKNYLGSFYFNHVKDFDKAVSLFR